ncbi:MAG TPA: ATP-binding protein [Dehalococcoidia bacterium]|nr:ATP-binding protein [Dehalococcoidia bacterium]
MASAGHLLTRDELLRLLFGTLQPLLEFDAVATVQCRNGEDRSIVFAARPLQAQFTEEIAGEVLESLRRFSGEPHQRCVRRPVEVVPLGKETRSGRESWAGPAQSAVDAPLIVGGRAVGLVRVVASASNAFPAEKSAIIYASAQQASAFLERLDETALADRRLAESLVNGLQDGIIIVDREMRTTLSNAAAGALIAALTGRPPAPDANVQATPLEELAREALANPGTPQHRDFGLSEESQRYLSATATTLGSAEEGAILVLRDVTEEHLMQERLLQSEKMASVGQLVSGVAHELNNPLTGVTGFAQLLLNRDLDEQTRHDVQTIYSEAERAAKIVQNLLSFARRRKAQKGLVNLNTLLERVLELRSYDLRVKNIDLELDLDPRLPLTMSDPDQIQQVFFNIVTNAEHAMLRAHDGGKLKVRSRAEKGFIHLSFIDDGVGIPPENLRRVFDPFFTTKEGGQGTGLGLTISYGIVDDHAGRMRVESRPGKGATFIVELPIVQGPELPVAEIEREIEPAKISRRVLVVDDEESILALLRDVLAADGHRVDTARNGEEALTHLAEHGYDLLITDIKMPGMGGQALYQRVKQMDSELAKNTVFITGDTVSVETRNFLHRVQNVCLAKPFKIREVKETLNRLLGDN